MKNLIFLLSLLTAFAQGFSQDSTIIVLEAPQEITLHGLGVAEVKINPDSDGNSGRSFRALLASSPSFELPNKGDWADVWFYSGTTLEAGKRGDLVHYIQYMVSNDGGGYLYTTGTVPEIRVNAVVDQYIYQTDTITQTIQDSIFVYPIGIQFQYPDTTITWNQ